MARVTKKQPAHVDIPPPTYNIELTHREAAVLFALFGRIGGWSKNCVRVFTDNVYSQLSELGFEPDYKLRIFANPVSINEDVKMTDFPERPA